MDIIDYDPDIMNIFSREVLKRITNGEDGWQEMLPEGIAEIIEQKHLFVRKEVPEEEEVEED